VALRSAATGALFYCVESEDFGLPLCTPTPLTSKERDENVRYERGTLRPIRWFSFVLYFATFILFSRYLSGFLSDRPPFPFLLVPFTTVAPGLRNGRPTSPAIRVVLASKAPGVYVSDRKRCLPVDSSRPPDPVLLRSFSPGTPDPSFVAPGPRGRRSDTTLSIGRPRVPARHHYS